MWRLQGLMTQLQCSFAGVLSSPLKPYNLQCLEEKWLIYPNHPLPELELSSLLTFLGLRFCLNAAWLEKVLVALVLILCAATGKQKLTDMFQWSQMEAWWIGSVSFNTEGRHLWTSLNPRYIIKDDGNNMQHFGSMCAPPNSLNQILKGPPNQITLSTTTGSPLLPDYLINLLQIKYKLLKV